MTRGRSTATRGAPVRTRVKPLTPGQESDRRRAASNSSPSGGAPRPGKLSTRARLAIFVAVCVVAVGATAISVMRRRSATASQSVSVAANQTVDPQGLTGRAFLLFRSTALNREFGRLGVVPLADPTGPRALTSLKCDRVDFEGGRGVCLTGPTAGPLSSAIATVFDARFHVLRTVSVTGYPSRVRVSPDGHYAAITGFVSGDSYATMGFSTRTGIIDLRTGKVVLPLEQLTVRRNGSVFQAADFNFWGVTFAQDSRRFYATLGTGGHTYLIQGDVDTRQATVLRADVECPSLSPDNRQIAFKKRVPGPTVTWRLSVLDLATLKDHPAAETRNVDDQAEWLDNNTILYGLPGNGSEVSSLSAASPGPPILGGTASIATDTWAVDANGGGTPRKFSPLSWSSVVVR